MAYSVIQIRYGAKSHGIYCSEKKAIILDGSADDMWAMKELFDEKERVAANKEYMDALLKERLNVLISAGSNPQEAEQFLRTHMKYLFYENKETKYNSI